MPRHGGNAPHGSRRHHRAAHSARKGKGPRCQAKSSQAEPIGATWPATTDELVQVSDNNAGELLPAADGGDHRAEQAFQGQRTGQADQDPAAPGTRLAVSRRGQSGCASTATPKAANPRCRSTATTWPYRLASSSSARAAPSGAASQRESTPASSPTPGRPGPRVRDNGDQVDHHDRHQYYRGHAPGIAFQGERLVVFPGEPLAGERRTMSSRGTARGPA